MRESELRERAKTLALHTIEVCDEADFINKFHIALKECAETEYWLEILMGAKAISEAKGTPLLQECGVIRRMLVKSMTTAKTGKE